MEPTDSSERPWTGEKALPKFRHSPLVMDPEPEAWGLTFTKHVLQPRPCTGVIYTHAHTIPSRSPQPVERVFTDPFYG